MFILQILTDVFSSRTYDVNLFYEDFILFCGVLLPIQTNTFKKWYRMFAGIRDVINKYTKQNGT